MVSNFVVITWNEKQNNLWREQLSFWDLYEHRPIFPMLLMLFERPQPHLVGGAHDFLLDNSLSWNIQQFQHCLIYSYLRVNNLIMYVEKHNRFHPKEVFSWVHQWPVLKTMISAFLYFSADSPIKSSRSVSFFPPFLSATSHCWTKKGDTKNSTLHLYSWKFYISTMKDFIRL